MKLQKLEQKNLKDVLKSKIICYVKVKEYLHDINSKYQLLGNITAIVDEHKRNWGECFCDGFSIPVLREEYLKEVDWNTHVILITSEYYKEIYDKICNNDFLRKKIENVYYYANTETEYYEAYVDYYKDCELEDIIVFRSGPRKTANVVGMDFSDNARCLFEYMLQNNYNEKYKLVWMVREPELYYDYEKYYNVYFVSYDWADIDDKTKRDLYYYYVCLAKYFFFTDALDLARYSRNDQIRVQLWHGQGIKTRAIFSSFEKRCEYTSVTSEVFQKIHQDIFGYREEQVLVTGIAKQDWIFHKVSKTVLQKLGIPEAKKYIYWLPTFRTPKEGLEALSENATKTDTGLAVLNTIESLQQMNEILKEAGIVLVIKPHPMQDTTGIKHQKLSNIIFLEHEMLVKEDVHIYQLLGYADALVSDYSSVAVDYLVLDRPIAFIVDDLEEFKKSRGFVFDNIQEWLPGKEIYNEKDLRLFIDEIMQGIDSSSERRRKICNEWLVFKDDQNCKRIVDAIGITRVDK